MDPTHAQFCFAVRIDLQDDQAAQPAADAVDQPAADAAAVGPDALDEMQREVDDAFELI